MWAAVCADSEIVWADATGDRAELSTGRVLRCAAGFQSLAIARAAGVVVGSAKGHDGGDIWVMNDLGVSRSLGEEAFGGTHQVVIRRDSVPGWVQVAWIETGGRSWRSCVVDAKTCQPVSAIVSTPIDHPGHLPITDGMLQWRDGDFAPIFTGPNRVLAFGGLSFGLASMVDRWVVGQNYWGIGVPPGVKGEVLAYDRETGLVYHVWYGQTDAGPGLAVAENGSAVVAISSSAGAEFVAAKDWTPWQPHVAPPAPTPPVVVIAPPPVAPPPPVVKPPAPAPTPAPVPAPLTSNRSDRMSFVKAFLRRRRGPDVPEILTVDCDQTDRPMRVTFSDKREGWQKVDIIESSAAPDCARVRFVDAQLLLAVNKFGEEETRPLDVDGSYEQFEPCMFGDQKTLIAHREHAVVEYDVEEREA